MKEKEYNLQDDIGEVREKLFNLVVLRLSFDIHNTLLYREEELSLIMHQFDRLLGYYDVLIERLKVQNKGNPSNN